MEYYPHIVCDPDKCTGCRMCELACSFAQEGVFNPLLSRIRNVRIEPIVQMTISCRLCQDPPCVTSCPRKALSQSEKTGVIIVDEDLCDGCGWCVEACPFGAIVVNPDKKVVVICDLCQDFDEPQCVKYCLKEALSLSSTEMVAQKARKEATIKLLQELAGS